MDIDSHHDHANCEACKYNSLPKSTRRKIDRISLDLRTMGATMDVAIIESSELRLRLTLRNGDQVLLPNWSQRVYDEELKGELERVGTIRAREQVESTIAASRATYQRELAESNGQIHD